MLNSAPVQLLPVDHGNEHQKKVSEQVRPQEPAKRFDEVLESAVNRKDPEQPSGQRETEFAKAESSTDGGDSAVRKKSSGADQAEQKGTTESGGKELSRDSEKSEESNNRKSEKSASQKKGLDDSSREELSAALSGMADRGKAEQPKTVKIGRDEVKSGTEKITTKADPAEFLKSFTGLFGAVRPEIAAGNDGGGKKKDTAGAGKGLKAGGKLSGEGAKNLMMAVSGRKGEKAGNSALGIAGTISGKGGKSSLLKGKSEKSETKLKVVDHRKAEHAPDSRNNFKLYSDEALRGPGASGEDSGKTIEINAQSDSLKIEGRHSDPRSHQSSVLSQLKEGVNDQIVKQAGIIVKANGSGEIKLVMRPEQLGKVRIQLSLNDNHIAGRIIVENNIVREIFESNLENLYKAFGMEGFENGGLEVTVQGGDAGDSGKRSPGGLNRRAVKAIEDAVPEIVDTEWQSNAVNMVV